MRIVRWFSGVGSVRGGGSRPAFLVQILAIGVLATAIGLAACSRSDRGTGTKLSKRVVAIGQPVPKGGGRYKVGSPYQIAGRRYVPKEQPRYDRVGVASWYGELFHGRYTANGEIFDMDALTAAHPTLPLPVYAQVTNLANNRSIVVRINDRGPYAHNRIIDLSRRSARMLGVYRPGTARVRVRYLGKAPLNGDDSYERRILASQPWARMAMRKHPETHTRVAEKRADERRSDPTVTASARRAQWRTRTSAQQPMRASTDVAPVAARPRARGPDQARPMLFVQAGSFRSRENADGVRRRLKALGPVHIFPAEIAGTLWYRVRLGPFPGDGAADEALRQAVAAGAEGARIVGN